MPRISPVTFRYTPVLVLASLMGIDVQAATPPSRYEFAYEAEIARPTAATGPLRIWLPLPATVPEQSVEGIHVESPVPHRETREPKFGNRMAYFEFRDLSSLPAKIRVVSLITRSETIARPSDPARLGGVDDPRNFLGPDRLVPLQGAISELATREVKGARTDDEKILRLYRYTVATMTYNKDGQGWGKGDAIWACTNKRGNCTDFHSLLIGAARSQGVPGRFEIGFPIPDTESEQIPGYHCWAKLYSARDGWVPVDASESKKAGEPMKFFGHLPPDRIQFTTGRDLVLEPRQSGEPLNFFIYPYAELGGQKWDSGITTKFTFRRLK